MKTEEAQLAQHRFKIGDRVRLSRLGKQRTRKLAMEIGTVVGVVSSRNIGSVRILFDGLKTAQSLHRTYIEPVNCAPTE